MLARKHDEERENRRSLLGRRDLLKAAAGLAIGSMAGPAWATHLRTKSRKNFRLGITSHVYGQLPLDEAARRIKEDGFRSILTNYQFADVRFDPLNPDWAAADKIVGTFEKQGVAIAAIFGYYNVIDPDLDRRKQGEARMEFYLRNWKRLGCPIVSTETGTFNRESQWMDSPENDTEEAFVQAREAFRRWARLGEETGGVLTIEAYWRNVVGTIERAERLLKEVDSPALKLVMDPCNYFRSDDLPRMKAMLQEMFQRLGPKIAIAHAKDVKDSPQGPEHPAPGRGVLDYPLYFRLLAELDRPLDLVIEHLALDDVARSRDFVLGHIERLP
ncbi:MAG: sugar phosphate isomerase/epimerase [Pirellulales bacterium]|nr:sugar phosphate isomerase/epimerase [Pirellulales bacterium]